MRVCLLAALSASILSAQSVDAILSRHLQAMGGLQKLHAIRSMRLKGTLELGPGAVLPVVLEVARPNRSRLEARAEKVTLLRVFDGNRGWQTDLATGALRPFTVAEEQAAQDETFDGDLIEPMARGARAELVGRQMLNGRHTYQVRLTEKDGTKTLHWIDCDLFLEFQREREVDTPDGRRTQVTRFSDFRLLEGIPTPFHVETGVKFAQQREVVQIREAQVNPAIPDADFTAPR